MRDGNLRRESGLASGIPVKHSNGWVTKEAKGAMLYPTDNVSCVESGEEVARELSKWRKRVRVG